MFALNFKAPNKRVIVNDSVTSIFVRVPHSDDAECVSMFDAFVKR